MTITEELRKEIKDDIAKCESHAEAKGSESLYGLLVAKYSVLDSDFSKSLSTNGKAAVLGSEFDYRQELKAIAAKLRMWLLSNTSRSVSPDSNLNPLKAKVDSFIKRGEEILIKEKHIPERGIVMPSYVSGPLLDAWMGEINIFNERYLKIHPLYNNILSTYSHYKKQFSSCEDMLGHLRALTADDEFWNETAEPKANRKEVQKVLSNKIFVVHGHDEAAKEMMARTLEKVDFEAIILHEQASSGNTIIEKIEANTDVSFAVVLYTQCDLGRAKEAKVESEKYRARQNVVFEHGYLIGKLGRNRVCALVKGDVETPGDISGVVYISMDAAGAWKYELAKEMRAAGLSVDSNKF